MSAGHTPKHLWEVLAAGYVAVSGKRYHASDCATSSAPAMEPGPCDCGFASVGPWLPIDCYNEAQHGREVLICGGSVLYDAETFPSDRPFIGVALAYLKGAEWCGGYGSEYDAEYWHKPTHFMPTPATPDASRTAIRKALGEEA